MAEKKEKKLTASTTVTTPSGYTAKEAKPVGNAGGLRAGAVILWVVAIVFEILAVLVLFGKINITFMPQLWQLIAFIVLDLVCVIIGSQLWKKANHIKPASKQNALKFWLWNNMGVIVSCFAFVPIIILMLTNKDLDKKTKTIAVIAAVIALIIGGAASIDYNPVSQEELTAAEAALGETTVYWAPFGKVYHTHDDCSALNVSETLTYGTVDQAIAENRTRLCKFCAKRDNIENVTTDETK
ncbi:MAG: hypothetical protein II164_04845 [Firmicutes bacterium]|nr:hypothetical protein [Bacillota bacterium]MBQ5415111.1 hypothetical protein [Bacillota bacterium]